MRALIARLDDGEDFDAAIRLMAAPAVFLAAVLRLKSGKEAVRPDASLSQAADILRMLNGTSPTRSRSRAWMPIW